jgi:polysaccharide biosynthesis/export protein
MNTTNQGPALSRAMPFFLALALIHGAALADPAQPTNPGSAREGVNVAVAAPTSATGMLQMDEYQIGPFDLLEISVFQVAEMSRTVRVNSRGLISLPLVGAIEAGGRTAQELETSIAQKLGEGYLQDPQVSVFIKEYVSQRVTIEGSVLKAGIYPLVGHTTLLQAIAMASGVDTIANETEVKIFRQKGGTREALVYDLDAIRSGKVADPPIKGNDVVVVERSATRSAVKTVSDTIRGILSIGRY